MSHDCGGARYNTLEPDILGMQNVSESLNCIYHLVFKEKKISLSEYKAALKADFEGEYANLRAYIINKITHFGNNEETPPHLLLRETVLPKDHITELPLVPLLLHKPLAKHFRMDCPNLFQFYKNTP